MCVLRDIRDLFEIENFTALALLALYAFGGIIIHFIAIEWVISVRLTYTHTALSINRD